MNPLPLVFLGFAATTVQIVLLRELLTIFNGNELTIGLILSLWMICIAFGAAITGKNVKKCAEQQYFGALAAAAGLLLPFEIFSLRVLMPFVSKTPFETPGIINTFLISFLVLLLPCLIFGVLFNSGSKIYFAKHNYDAKQRGMAYSLESFGSVMGGMAASFILIRYFSSFEILSGFSAACFLIALLLTFDGKGKVYWSSGLFLILTLVMFTTGIIEKTDEYSMKCQLKPFKLIESRNTLYGCLKVIDYQGEFSFYQDGSRIFSSTNDRHYCEELIGFGMLTAGSTRNVLVLGGGINGKIAEIFKFPAEKIAYVEIDPVMIEMAQKYMREEDKKLITDKKVEIISADIRSYVRNTKEKYDCIILGLPGPETSLMNRCYTQEFFSEAKKSLSPGGTLVLSLPSLENYMAGELRSMSSCVYFTGKYVFKNCVILPGERNYYVFSDGMLTDKPGFYTAKMKQYGIKPMFLTDNSINYMLNETRVSKIREEITGNETFQLNRDFKPACYFNSMLLWSSYSGAGLIKILKYLETGISYIFIFVLVIMLVICVILKKKGANYSVLMNLGIVGFTAMLVELMVIFAYQSVYGYLYYRIGLIITSGMAGVAAGSFLFSKGLTGSGKRQLFIIEAILLLVTAAMPAFFNSGLPEAAWFGVVFVPCFCSGAVFSIISAIIGKDGVNTGVLYAVDLAGAAASTLIGSIFMIPALGIAGTAFMASIGVICGIIMLFFI